MPGPSPGRATSTTRPPGARRAGLGDDEVGVLLGDARSARPGRPSCPASSISRAACPPGGFLNTLPQFGSASGCVRRRQSRASSMPRRIAAGSLGSSRSVAPTTIERRRGRRSSGRRTPPPTPRRCVSRRSRHRTGPPLPPRPPSPAVCAPAFILTAPPRLAGIATPNSNPPKPCRERDAGERRKRHRAARR